MQRQLELTVNSHKYELEVSSKRLLVQLLRDGLGLTGTKEG